MFGACAGEHGHNYVIEVSVSGGVEPETGMVINLKDEFDFSSEPEA